MTEVAVAPRRLGSRKVRIAVALAAVAAALTWVAVSGLSRNLVYYKTPTEILMKQQRFKDALAVLYPASEALSWRADLWLRLGHIDIVAARGTIAKLMATYIVD